MKCTPNELRGIYDDFATRYDRHIMWLERIAGLRNMRQKLFQQACGDVLDVATGTGANYEFFPASCNVTGVDLSTQMLEVAKGRANTLGRTIHLQPMNAERLEYPTESFDTVASGLSLCTIPDPVRALQEMSRVCKKDGKILLLEHGPSDWAVIAVAQELFVGEWHVRKFGCHWDREPQQLIKQAGLTIRSHRRHFFGMLHAIEAMK
ncbi:MAG TPA: methyltransferase domain-containing protein [Candidatus Peribacterales bacterium]|nr:methyltransferase domain-containing protein [Candidatus Peribacterales bacterium]